MNDCHVFNFDGNYIYIALMVLIEIILLIINFDKRVFKIFKARLSGTEIMSNKQFFIYNT